MFHARYIPSMEQTPPPRLSTTDRRATAAAAGRWLYDRMIERDYNLSARGGGQRRLAEQTGLSPATISRLLTGSALNPDPESLRRIADQLGLPFPEMLVQFGVLTAAELHAVQTTPPSDRPPLTEEQAAAEVGITDPVALDMYKAGVRAARELQEKRLQQRAD
jgi:transcriptional regulator with XRE-family HTH domain